MSETPVQLLPADEADLEEVIALLRANDLPTADVSAKADSLYAATADGEFVGAGGLEVHGAYGLLRSVVVAEPERGNGYGTAICDALERLALENGVERLYLLTTTATEFFRRRGYEPTDREAVPPSIRRTREFDDLCPSTATCLRKERPASGGSSERVDATPP